MGDTLSKEVLLRLDVNNFTEGQTVLHCLKCHWQADGQWAMKPVCPNCRSHLQSTRVDQELLKAIIAAEKR